MPMTTVALPRVLSHARSMPSQSKAAPKRPCATGSAVIQPWSRSGPQPGQKSAGVSVTKLRTMTGTRDLGLYDAEIERFVIGGLLADAQRVGACGQVLGIEHEFERHGRARMLPIE